MKRPEVDREPEPGLRRVVGVETDEVGELYAHACAPLIGLLTVIGGNRADAEEVAQDSFVRLLEHWPDVRDFDHPEAWLRTVAVRMLISRHRRRQVASLGLRKLAARERWATPISTSETQIDVADAVAALPMGHRAVVLLHHLEDLSVDEVASLLRIPEGTVKSRLSRARASLAPLLADEERSTT